MEVDKKAGAAKVVGYFCVGFAVILFAAAIVFITGGRSEPGLLLLVIGLCLLATGVVNLVRVGARPA